MLIHYRKGRRNTCYDPECLTTVTHEPVPPPQGPFPSCEGCPYPASGFLCYAAKGSCLRTEMQKIIEKGKNRNE